MKKHIVIPIAILMVGGLLAGGDFSQAEALGAQKVDTRPSIIYERKIDREISYELANYSIMTNPQPTQTPEPIVVVVEREPTTEELFLKYFPEESFEETVLVLGKTLHGEAEGVKSTTNRAAVVWCILNRVDTHHRGNTPIECATASSQFAYDKHETPREDELEIVRDVLGRWLKEKEGAEDVGRVLPSDYFFFTGNGSVNRFRKNDNSKHHFVPRHSEVYGD